MNIESLWASFEENKGISLEYQILKTVYFNTDNLKIADIREEFDTWSITNLKILFEYMRTIPSYEMEVQLNTSFGEDAYIFDFFEVATSLEMQRGVLKRVQPKKKRFF